MKPCIHQQIPNNDIEEARAAQPDLKEMAEEVYSAYPQVIAERLGRNCITGDQDHLLLQLKEVMRNAVEIDIIVSFLMESGVRLILEDLRAAAERGVAIRILTGGYLNITEPSALYLLKDTLGSAADLRFYGIENKSFHAKAYIFKYKNGEGGDVFVGSSNVSRSALTSGIEWNYRISEKVSENDYHYFRSTFAQLFDNYSKVLTEEELKRYSRQWKKPKVHVPEPEERTQDGTSNLIAYPRPMGAQIEALYELKKSRSEGFDKGLVVAATGIGKTYLAAFDSREYGKILFVAHRGEILKQAMNTFGIVRPDLKLGMFTGAAKDSDCDIVMASVQTLGKEEYLDEAWFRRDEFEYIVIDEVHHGVAKNYANIMEYFTPAFMLGLTATPDRMDNKDVFAIFDYNIVYEVRLKEAIDKGWLVPFRYYGIYDDTTNYDDIEYRNGKYDEKMLEEALMIHKRAELILQHYMKYPSKRALGFCTSRAHAEYMAKHFCGSERGINAVAVYSGEAGEYSLEREDAIARLNAGEIQVIFSVDMFNEGLDIPAVDLVMFLRPTQSPTVFLQQLGRGLRRSIGKRYLNVLDFIGNYKKANLIPGFLTGKYVDSIVDRKKGKGSASELPAEEEFPEDCRIDFDFRLIDYFKRIAEAERKSTKLKDIVIQASNLAVPRFVVDEYHRIKEYVGSRPSRLELYTYFEDDLYELIKPVNNVFKDYLWFLSELGETTADELRLLGTVAHEFIKMVETTDMSKSYKMPIFLAFYNKGSLKLSLSDEDIYQSFYGFYAKGTNHADLTRHKSGEDYKKWGRKQYLSLSRRNPEKFLLQSAAQFFYRNEQGTFCLNENLAEFASNPAFMQQFKDAIDYRTRKYYKERVEKHDKS